MNLTQLLASNLAITEEQAKGGAGSLFRLAKEHLSAEQFRRIEEKVSGIPDMIAAAPNTDGVLYNIRRLISSLGGNPTGAGGFANLASSFERLDLDPDIAGRFVKIVAGFVRQRGGDELGNLFDGALSSPYRRVIEKNT